MISKKIRVRTILESIYYAVVGRDVEIVSASPDIRAAMRPQINTPEFAQVVAELLALNCALRPEVPSPFRHWSLSTHPGEPMHEHWEEVGDLFLAGHGIDQDQHSFVIFRHLDQDKDHIHPIFCRIGHDGSLARDTFCDCAISQKVCRKVEEKFGLRQLQSSVPEKKHPGPTRPKRNPRPTRAEAEMTKRGVPTLKNRARSTLDSVWPRAGEIISYASFCERLATVGVDILLNRRGSSVGVSYMIAGHLWKASTLGENYQWIAIEPHISALVDSQSAEMASREVPMAASPAPEQAPFQTKEKTIPRHKPITPTLPSVNILALLEVAYDRQTTIYTRDEKRRNREDFARAFGPKDRGIPRPGRGPRPTTHVLRQNR